MRILFALKTFFRVLLSASAAKQVEAALNGSQDAGKKPDDKTASEAAKKTKETGKIDKIEKTETEKTDSQPQVVEKVIEKVVEKIVEKRVVEKPLRSDALTLLAALQREARFIDFLQEDIQPFDDAQIGAIVRDVHRGCAQTIKRVFNIEPLSDKPEGDSITLESGFDPLQYKIDSTTASGTGSVTGTIVHPGWKATRCELPVWTGAPESAMVVAPVEIEG